MKQGALNWHRTNPPAAGAPLLLLRLLLHGYQSIEVLAQQSNNTFRLKAGIRYHLLRGVEQAGLLVSYEQPTPKNRTLKSYDPAQSGQAPLQKRQPD